MSARAGFTRMQDSTKEDWALILPEAMKMAKAPPERVLAHLALLDGDYGDFPVDRYDDPAFDPKAETFPVATFEPILQRVFATPRNSVYKAALEAKA